MIESKVMEIGNELVVFSTVHIQFRIFQYLIPFSRFYIHLGFQHNPFASIVVLQEIVKSANNVNK